jgi:ubiquitin-protein ligase E3 B/ubiquitin-protein ligase E3 C
VELIADGSDVPVTNANRLQYIALVADWHLNGGSRGKAAAAFAQGLGQVMTRTRRTLSWWPVSQPPLSFLLPCFQVVPLSWLHLFSPKELNEVVGGGTAGELDVEDMK